MSENEFFGLKNIESMTQSNLFLSTKMEKNTGKIDKIDKITFLLLDF